jgi:hypothetical protein
MSEQHTPGADPTDPAGDHDLLEPEVTAVPGAVLSLPVPAWIAAGQEGWAAASALLVGLQLARVFHAAFEAHILLSKADLDYVRAHAPQAPALLHSNRLLWGDPSPRTRRGGGG